MQRRYGRDIVHRSERNPIITMDDLSFRCADICNAGAIKIDEEYVLLITIRSLQGYCLIYTARGTDGTAFEVEDQPLLSPSRGEDYAEFEERGVSDARVVAVDGRYYIAYDTLGRHGFCLALAETTDFDSVTRIGIISQPDTKAGPLFPRKIDGRYARLERPWNGGRIWVTYSEDLEFWGGSEVVMAPRSGFWDSSRIGAATPPFEIEEGWLFLYYGIKDTSAGPLFRLGAAILDREDPAKVVGRTNVPILAPREEYERIGDMPNLVFSCGAIMEPDGQMKIYYGAARSCICLGITDVDTVVSACKQSDREY